MSLRNRLTPLLAMAGVLLWASAALAENEGQAELDQAIEAKLSAENLDDLQNVISLARQALDKGLDEENTLFAKRLLASAYVQRGGALSEAIFQSSPSGVGWLEQMNRVRLSALSDLEEAVALDAENVEALYLVGRLNLLPEGDRDRAQEALDAALKLAGDENVVRAKIHAARVSLHKESDAKIAELTEAIKAMPGQADYVRARGLAYADAGKMQEAIADLEKAVELDPDSVGSYEALSLVFATTREFDKAIEMLDKLIALRPDAPLAYAQRARLQLLQGKPGAAVDDLDKALELLPDNPTMLLLRSEAQQKQGNTPRALADVEAVLKQRSDYLPALQMRGLLLADSGKLEEAVADIQKVADESPQDPLPRLQLAMIQFSRKKMHAAIDEFTKVIELDPQNWIARQGRADAYLAIGKQAEALADYDEGVKLQPNNSAILNNLAWLLATSPDDELRDGQRAIELATLACKATDYKQAHILSTLAAGYAETGDFETAREWSAKALEISDDRHRDALTKELESYRAEKPWRELQTEETHDEPPADAKSEKPAAPADDADAESPPPSDTSPEQPDSPDQQP